MTEDEIRERERQQMAQRDKLQPEKVAEPPLAGSLEYWKRRALQAEARIRELQQRSYEEGWALENYRHEAQIRRDAEIGFMGGGG